MDTNICRKISIFFNDIYNDCLLYQNKLDDIIETLSQDILDIICIKYNLKKKEKYDNDTIDLYNEILKTIYYHKILMNEFKKIYIIDKSIKYNEEKVWIVI